MSAQVASSPQRETSRPAPSAARARDHLKALAPAPRLAARYPFIMLLATVLGAGLVGLLVLNTMIQSQSRDLEKLQTQANELSYQQASLTSQVQVLRSSSALQQRAYQLGMRPNPTPAFIMLPSGQILGTPTKVTGKEAPGVVPGSWDQQQGSQEQSRAKIAQAKLDAANRAKAEAAKKEQARKQKQAADAKKQAAQNNAAQNNAAQNNAAQNKQQGASAKPSAKPSVTKAPQGGR